MKIKTAEYVGSFPKVTKCPKGDLPEYAFIGRSNVGKSSLINMICERRELARISKKPGKTQYLNYYIINKAWHLVDLPGYGYAKISKTKRKQWEKMIEGYLLHRANLICAFVLVDINVPPQAIDIEFLNWMGKMQIPFVIAFTKSDRLKPQKLDEQIEHFQHELHKYWNELPPQFITSSRNKTGKEAIHELIESTNSALNTAHAKEK